MDTALDQGLTTESFLVWEDRQEFKYEFDGRRVIPMTGGSIAHQRIVANLWATLTGLLGGQALMAIQEMACGSGPACAIPISSSALVRSIRRSEP